MDVEILIDSGLVFFEIERKDLGIDTSNNYADEFRIRIAVDRTFIDKQTTPMYIRQGIIEEIFNKVAEKELFMGNREHK